MKALWIGAALLATAGLGRAALVDTTSASAVSSFQNGADVLTFDAVQGRTPQAISSYTAGDPVSATALIFDEFANVRFSVGGTPGVNKPALYQLSGGIAGDAASGDTVLGPVDFDGTTKFNANALLEVFFPVKVSKVGMWLNPSLGDVLIIAADTNFAFSGINETTLESASVAAGHFVGFERAGADIGGFKVLALGATGFSVDDFTYGVSAIPETSTLALFACGLLLMGMRQRRR